MAQRKETNKKVKVRDLHPKKDAKGGTRVGDGRPMMRPGSSNGGQQTRIWGG